MKHPGYTEEHPDRVNTVHGTKTVLGLGRMILREIENIERNHLHKI